MNSSSFISNLGGGGVVDVEKIEGSIVIGLVFMGNREEVAWDWLKKKKILKSWWAYREAKSSSWSLSKIFLADKRLVEEEEDVLLLDPRLFVERFCSGRWSDSFDGDLFAILNNEKRKARGYK